MVVGGLCVPEQWHQFALICLITPKACCQSMTDPKHRLRICRCVKGDVIVRGADKPLERRARRARCRLVEAERAHGAVGVRIEDVRAVGRAGKKRGSACSAFWRARASRARPDKDALVVLRSTCGRDVSTKPRRASASYGGDQNTHQYRNVVPRWPTARLLRRPAASGEVVHVDVVRRAVIRARHVQAVRELVLCAKIPHARGLVSSGPLFAAAA